MLGPGDRIGQRHDCGILVGTRCRATDAFFRSLHVTFGGGWAGIQILVDKFDSHVRAPFEKTLFQCLEQRGYSGIAE